MQVSTREIGIGDVQVSTIGAFILLTGLSITLFCLLHSLFKGKPAVDNPWGAASMEWQTATPPIKHNFHETPKVRDPYEVDKYVLDEATGNYVRKNVPGEAPEAH